jgi:ketosteroid isomerase-like protein
MLKRQLCIAAATAACLIVASTVQAQQLNRQQQEVWNAVTAITNAFKAGKLKEVEKLYHPDFTGWYPGDPFPSTKQQDMTYTKHLLATRNIKFILRHPTRIVVRGDVAIAQYFTAAMQVTKKQQKEKYSTLQWTDTWVKEGGRWKILATHGTRVKP